MAEQNLHTAETGVTFCYHKHNTYKCWAAGRHLEKSIGYDKPHH